MKEWSPERAAPITGLDAETIRTLARRYGNARAAFVRINYGLQRHAGGGMAVRTIACLPAVTGHWRFPGGGVQLSTSANFKFNAAALERPDLNADVRTINMIRLGEALPPAALVAGWLGSAIGVVGALWVGVVGSVATVLPILTVDRVMAASSSAPQTQESQTQEPQTQEPKAQEPKAAR